ncbi:MAG: transposase [Patescibacteria group bacterium]
MTRPLRIEYPGAVYHITSRGNKKMSIYESDEDRVVFLKVLAKIIRKHHWKCYAYCLMLNHYHLLVETTHGNLSTGMRDLNGIYTQMYNKKHETVGHIFQGRFKAFLIEKETYLFEVARYIVLNPVRAGIVKTPQKYRWSNYLATAGLDFAPSFLDVDGLLKNFGYKRTASQEQYRAFILDGIHRDSPFIGARPGMILGSPQFESEISKITGDPDIAVEVTKDEKLIGRLTLAELFEVYEGKNERNEIVKLAVNGYGYSNASVAKHLGLSNTTISLIARGKK